jgi:dTDP-glucose 4,6-dehydratase
MKKVLVTGGLGFIGSNWVNQFHDEYSIIIIDAGYKGSDVKNLSTPVPIIEKDINDLSPEEFKVINPDVVIHFAAESHVDRSIDNPVPFVQSNVNGTINLLELIRKNKPDTRFIHISTDEVFGHLNLDDPPFKETTPYDPRSPYSASKASSDMFVRSYANTYGLDVCITNTCNNFGPNQDTEKLLPKIITNALSGKSLPIYGKGLNWREWIFVEDNCRALTAVLEDGKSGETYCIGSGQELSNIELVREVCNMLDDMYPNPDHPYSDQIVYVDDRAGHDLRYSIDRSKIKRELGWEPKVSLREGLINTIDYYQKKLI